MDTKNKSADISITEDDVDTPKSLKIKKEKKNLLESLSGGDFSKLRTRVAYILNLYPESRNSDITLTIKYWETFQSEVYDPNGIKPKDLFVLERLHYIVRARAKIQNEYNLFTSSTEVRRFRKKHEEEISDAVIADSKPASIVHVFADETGKTQQFVIVSSVWVLTGFAVYSLSRNISEWQENSFWKNREVHFSKLGKKDKSTLIEYINIIAQNSEFLSFKSVAVERSKTKRSIEEVIEKLHENMLIKGAEHEISSGRIGLPHTISVTLDEEQSLDAFTLNDLKERINDKYHHTYNDNVKISDLMSISSKKSPLVQLSDIIAGAINRKMNPPEVLNYKDEMASYIIDMLGLEFKTQEQVGELDISALFLI